MMVVVVVLVTVQLIVVVVVVVMLLLRSSCSLHLPSFLAHDRLEFPRLRAQSSSQLPESNDAAPVVPAAAAAEVRLRPLPFDTQPSVSL